MGGDDTPGHFLNDFLMKPCCVLRESHQSSVQASDLKQIKKSSSRETVGVCIFPTPHPWQVASSPLVHIGRTPELGIGEVTGESRLAFVRPVHTKH